MGKAARWLKALLSGGGGGRKKPESGNSPSVNPPAAPAAEKKKGWSFARSFRDKDRGSMGTATRGGGGGVEERRGPPHAAVTCRSCSHGLSDPLSSSSSCVAGGGAAAPRVVVVGAADGDNKRAIAVAAAAVAAAQAAEVVVRLTSEGRRAACGSVSAVSGRARMVEWAAVKIQSAFRGYLARRALKALKGLVKLQALVRGHVVRKQAAATLRCMQALVRVQARARAGRALAEKPPSSTSGSNKDHHHSVTGTPSPTLQKHGAAKQIKSRTHGRNGGRANSSGAIDTSLLQSSGWNWLDRWMEERYWDGRQTPPLGMAASAADQERNEKILEVDAGKPHPNYNLFKNHHHHSPWPAPAGSEQNSRSFASTVPDYSPSRDSTAVQRSVPSPPSVSMQQPSSPLSLPIDGLNNSCESTQYYCSATSRPGGSSRRGGSGGGPFVAPWKSDDHHSRGLFHSGSPHYMSNTEASKAKARRCQSAPRQRPAEYDKPGSSNRRFSAQRGTLVIGEELSSSSSQKSSSLHLKFAGKAYPGSGRLDRLGAAAQNCQ